MSFIEDEVDFDASMQIPCECASEQVLFDHTCEDRVGLRAPHSCENFKRGSSASCQPELHETNLFGTSWAGTYYLKLMSFLRNAHEHCF